MNRPRDCYPTARVGIPQLVQSQIFRLHGSSVKFEGSEVASGLHAFMYWFVGSITRSRILILQITNAALVTLSILYRIIQIYRFTL
jgi:hypothetical protein